MNLREPPSDSRAAATARRRWFRLAAILLPLFLLTLTEGILRVFGFGGYPPILRRVGPTEHGELVITDPAGTVSFFFANPNRPGYNEQYCFYEPRQSNAVRIVLVGESAMKGFPQPRNLAASAFLREMLHDALPGRQVEVLNLGTTAVASFPVLEILRQALEFHPTLVVISTGHNEFFGTYGVASTGWAGDRSWMLKAHRRLRSLALVQALARLLPKTGARSAETLMEVMMGQSYTAPDDPKRQAAADNLAAHVGEMVRLCRKRRVPAIVCTQPSNERNLAPLGEDRLEGLTPAQKEEFAHELEAGRAALATDPTSALAHLQRATNLCLESARAHFALGEALSATSRPTEALAEFIRARDLDTMPWRATSLSQAAIVRAADENGGIVCDLEAAFRKASPGGAIGWELMDDHVHPSLGGQVLLARTLLKTIAEILGPWPTNNAVLASDEEYARRLGDNAYDRYGVAHTVRVLFNIPFMRQTNPQAFQHFDQAASDFETNCAPEVDRILREWQTLTPHAGGKRPITGMVARELVREGKIAEAVDLYVIAQSSVPEYTSWHLEYVYFELACRLRLAGRLSEAERARALDAIKEGQVLLGRGFSETGFAERHVGRLHQLRGEFAEAIPFLQASRAKLSGTDLVAADDALILSYMQLGDFENARRIANYGRTHAGAFAGAYEKMLETIPAGPNTNGVSVQKRP